MGCIKRTMTASVLVYLVSFRFGCFAATVGACVRRCFHTHEAADAERVAKVVDAAAQKGGDETAWAWRFIVRRGGELWRNRYCILTRVHSFTVFVHSQQWTAMSNDDPSTTSTLTDDNKSQHATKARPAHKRGFFEIPPRLKRVFDKFPLITYGDNELPVKAQAKRTENVLYIFTPLEGARYGKPSFNPACLKWQVGISIARVDVRSVDR